MVKIKFIKSTEKCKKGDIVEASKKSAESYVSNGYAVYIKEPKTKKKQKTTKSNVNKRNKKEVIKQTPLDKEIINLLNNEKKKQFLENLKEKEINWLNDDWFNSWEKIKAFSKKVWNHKQDTKENTKLFLLGHDKNTVKGKPQLVENIQKTIPLVKKAVKSEKKFEPFKPKRKLQNIEIQSFYFFDESFDKRHDGFQKDSFALDFWLYKIISEDGKEYYLYSQEKLPNETCTFNGMLVELDDFTELSRSLKIKSVSKIFFVKSFIPDVKILSNEEIIKLIKDNEISEQDWLDYLALHSLGTLNRFPPEVEKLKSAWLLSGNYQGYPLHLAVIGPAGTKKSCGYIETVANKFSDNPQICEGGNSRLKGLVPSFKERPADLGYILKQDRIAFIDELGKMIHRELNINNQSSGDVLGDLNALLDCKERFVSSGNSAANIHNIAKCMFVMNPLSNCPTISSHVGRKINSTTMCRCLWWVQDKAEQEHCLSDKAIISENTYVSPRLQKFIKNYEKANEIDVNNNKNNFTVLTMCLRNILTKEQFLSLYDTCNNFICKIDQNKVRTLFEYILNLSKAQMTEVWKSRGEHHTFLLLDGLIKHRCLFIDQNFDFKATDKDYAEAKAILERMVRGWDTDLSIKDGQK